MAGITHRSRIPVVPETEGGRSPEEDSVPGPGPGPGPGRVGPVEGSGGVDRREVGVSRTVHVVNLRGRVVLGMLLGFFGTLAVVGLLVNGYRSSVPYASFLAFFTLALLTKLIIGDQSQTHRRNGYVQRRYIGGMGGGGRLVGTERVQYSRLNQRLSLVDRDFAPGDYDLLLELDNNSQRFRTFLEGASKDVVDRLPSYIFKPEPNSPPKSSNSSAGDVSVTKTGCTICLEEFSADQNIRILPCLHQFHVDCVDRWLYQRAKCPVCKFMIVDVEEAIPSWTETQTVYENPREC
ncbi:hypothetical protein NDN08_002337 [Rhodosorus marinus]|uniref:RING-type domain-containing protein n=1 Tax=Rhodosorus marinus TaxID=101924 RepID=A0AAV8UXV3_9RHOD|nr:hypothetical protein NDN08_002337 [Rhodosorus marinus]